jgi:hypothetical protein
MTRTDFDVEPFVFREDRYAWETERRNNPARPRAVRGAARRARPRFGRPRPAAIGFIEQSRCCACPVPGPAFDADDERFEFETLELESPSSMPTLRIGSRGSANDLSMG